MSGIIGHAMYAVLAAEAASHRQLPIAPLVRRHWVSYLAGSYLGCDVQTMPEAICVDTGREVGYGTVPLRSSPITGGAVRPFQLTFESHAFRPKDIHEIFYGRAHLTFGWSRNEQDLTLPWQHLAEYCAAVVEDSWELFGPGERPLAYALGWMTHLLGDGLIKSIWPGVSLHLLDGKYTPKNRPIQDLVTFHELGRKELQLNWPAMLADLADTPVEEVQLHFMRVGPRRGRLGQDFPEGWAPDREGLLRAVLLKNRQYLRIHNQETLRELELERTETGWECQAAQRQATGGLSYAQMVAEAEKAHFRRALWQVAEAIADLFAQVTFLVPEVRRIPQSHGPTWAELTKKWNTE